MIRQLRLVLFTGIALLYVVSPAHALPTLWETEIGVPLTQLTGEDDNEQTVALDFAFPLFDSTYTDISVSVNGVVSLFMAYHLPYAMKEMSAFMGTPMIAPFWTDLSLVLMGNVYFNNLDDRAVITWAEVGSFHAPMTPFSFQVQLLSDGGIIFGYNGIPDTTTALDEHLIVGVSTGHMTGVVDAYDYSIVNEVELRGTAYELFEIGGTGFDLDNSNISFMPFVDPEPPQSPPSAAPIPEPGSFVLLSVAIIGFIGYISKRSEKGKVSR